MSDLITPQNLGLASSIRPLLNAGWDATTVLDVVLDSDTASALSDCALRELYRCNCDAPHDEEAWRRVEEGSSIPEVPAGPPSVVITYDGYIREGKAVLEEIIAHDHPKRVRLYLCGSPDMFASERLDVIRGMANVLSQYGEDEALLKAAAWSGVRQAEVLGRIAENEFEFRQAVPEREDIWVDEEDYQRVVGLMSNFPPMPTLALEALAAALMDALTACYVVASAWARSLSGMLGDTGTSPAEMCGDITGPVSGNRLLYILKHSWFQFQAEHGREEPCRTCDPENCNYVIAD